MQKLLTRDEFRESVFKRDGNKCVICKNEAADAHHILDRKLFSDGGYYLNNGASLCYEHHIEAEKCEISVEEIREAAGITEIILPEGFDRSLVYDKWGQEVDEALKSRKYGRTYHFPWSPGAKNDDRINYNYWNDIQKINSLVITSKLDGENNCLTKYGVFARSHAAPTESKWTQDIRQRCDIIKNDLGDLQLFLENLYAIHSIEYPKLDSHYYVFSARIGGRCLSWEETKFYANLFDFPTVPELEIINPKDYTEEQFKEKILHYTSQQEVFDSLNPLTGENIPREGIVAHNTEEYLLRHFEHNCFKWVVKGHVKTDEHWTRNWKRAKLIWEQNKNNNNKIV